MNPEELDRELERLWAKVSPSSVEEHGDTMLQQRIFSEPIVSPSISPSQEATLEAIQLLKRRHREQIASWEEMLQAKEQALAALSERLKQTQSELVTSRRSGSIGEQRLMHEMYDVAAKLESSRQALESQEQRFGGEERLLRDLLDKTRQQLAAETMRWRDLEKQWNEREQRYLSELHDLQSQLGKVQEAGSKVQETNHKQSDDLQDAKKAIEATLTELLAERQQREIANQDREKAQQRVVELTERVTQLQKTWDEERKQWQELWDRERSTWEVQRQEFAGWEERLRKEREAWHQELQEKEGEVLRFSSQMTETLRESAETGTRLSHLLKTLSGPPTGIFGPYIPRHIARWVGISVAALALGVSSYQAWKYFTKPRFNLASSHVLTLDNPTSVAFDGSVLWAGEWSGRLVTLDPSNPATVLARHSVVMSTPYHPVSIALGAGYVWSLDSSQGRILKHNLVDPSAVQASWAAPGPAPVAIAFDGQNLWSYDAVTKSIYQHLGEGPGAQVKAYRPEIDMVPTSLMWLGKELWVHDSKGKRILRFMPGEKSLSLIDALDIDPSALSLAAYRVADVHTQRRMLWALTGTGPGSPVAPQDRASGEQPAPSRGGAEFTLKKYNVLP